LTKLVAAGAIAGTVMAFSAQPAVAAPVTPSFGPTIDNYASYDPQSTCVGTAQPGVVGFKNLLTATYSDRNGGIVTACSGGVSEHKEGRAFDYMLDVGDSAENAIANDILNWLLATDQYGNSHANARRLGVMYIIWNRQIWGSYSASSGWRPYSGDSPHTNHIHFSFSWAGARKETTWWTAGGGASNGPNAVVASDVTGDGRADLIARKPDGTLWLYTNGGSDTAPYSTGSQIGTSWQQFTWFLAGEVTGDGRADIVATRADGTLWLYTNGGSDTAPYSTGIEIGMEWQQFSHVTLEDVTGDGRADIVAARPDGTLWLYTNGGSDTAPYSTGIEIGMEWQQFTWVTAGDVTGDGRADLVAGLPNGNLMLYTNSGDAAAPYTTGVQIGDGWTMMNRVKVADVTGDGRADIVATRADGTLWLYTNGGSDTAPYSTGTNIGNGWQVFV
jgi:hypothetical protein